MEYWTDGEFTAEGPAWLTQRQRWLVVIVLIAILVATVAAEAG